MGWRMQTYIHTLNAQVQALAAEAEALRAQHDDYVEEVRVHSFITSHYTI
jgi:prefoldin subunit 5